jgi:hypothetical protein
MEMSQSSPEQTNEGVSGRRIQSRKVTAAIDCISLGTKKYKGLSAAILAGCYQFRAGCAKALCAPYQMGFTH